MPWDAKTQFYAFFRFIGVAAGQGASPFWNPFHYVGFPSAADPQSLVFNPAFRLLALMAPDAGMIAFDVLVFAHVLVGMLALLGLGRLQGWHPVAAVLAALVFGLGGSAAARLSHTGIVLGYGLSPLALLLLMLALRRGSVLASLGFGLVAALIAIGRDQVAILTCLMLIAAAGAGLGAVERPWRRLPHLALMGVVGALVVAAPVLLTAELAGLSNRPAIPYATAAAGSLHPVNLASLLTPDIFGAMSAAESGYFGPSARTRPWVDTTDRLVNTLYAGLVPAFLLLFAGIAGGLIGRPGTRFAAGLAFASLVYALGWFTPVYGLLFEHVPGVALFRRPADATFLLNLALALITGAVAARLIAEGWPRLTGFGTAVAGAVLIAIVAGALGFAHAVGGLVPSLFALGAALLAMAALAAAFRAARAPGARLGLMVLLTALTAGDLVMRNAASPLNAEPRAAYAILETPTPDIAPALAAIEADTARVRAAGQRPRVEILGLGGAAQNIAMVRGLEAINGYNPLRLSAVETLIGPGQNNHDAALRRFPETFPAWTSPLARRLSLTHLLLSPPLDRYPELAGTPGIVVLAGTPAAIALRLPDPEPRVTLDGGVAVLRDWRPDRIVIEVETPRPGVLVLTDPAYPGWIARIDGVKVPITTSDGLDRRVAVPAGRSTVVLAFEPLRPDHLLDVARRLLVR